MRFKRIFNNRMVALVMVSAILTGYSKKVQAIGSLDLNGDGVVDMEDYHLAVNCYEKADKLYDINGDGYVDVYDMTLISKGFDEKFADNDYYSIGNTHSNLLNSSYVVVDGDLVYYRNTQDKNKLYKSKLNSELKVKLTDDQVSSLNLIGNKIYYRNGSDGGKIYSIKIDGSERTLVAAVPVEDFTVSGQYIYYKSSADKKLYKSSLNGQGSVLISEDPVNKFIVRGTTIYYINSSQGNLLFRINIDGTGKMPVSSVQVTNFAYDEGRIYYVSGVDSKIYSMNLEGNDLIKVADYTAFSLNVNNGFIYYTDREDGRLYKMKTDGSERTAIQSEKLPLDSNSAKLLMDGNWIFYTNASDENRLYKITTEGNSKKDMETVVEGRVAVSQSLNLRQGPSTTDKVIGSLYNGAKVEIIGEKVNQGILWFKINVDINGTITTGYVSSAYILTINDDRMGTRLGVLSGKYESNGDPGIISNIPSDRGGKSYGAWQFASKVGTVDNFLVYLADTNVNFYTLLSNAKKADGGTFGTNFDAQWKALAALHYDEFLALQRDYVKKLYYDRAVDLIFKNTGIDTNQKSFAFRNVVWSTAVQHGVYGAGGPTGSYTKNGVIIAAYLENPVDELDFIKKIYLERAKLDVYFASYDPNNAGDAAVLNGLKTRFINEGNDAVAIYNYELSRNQ
ncbi:DUF5050 domain-containing protein [Clostridium thermarum]|uniref:DUF5050 domain-containing protein n=1 Tax=Clostridium thermarum TaxID=1716543 RepID=UPI0013D21FC9|nr:DUF5050 domain-containing protein [Clostridium thermarum]